MKVWDNAVAKDAISRTIEVGRSQENVFDLLLNVGTVAGFVPVISELVEIVELKEYSAVLEDQVGPFKLRADLIIKTVVDEILRSFSIDARGEDRQVKSAIRVLATLTVVASSETSSRIELSGTYEVSGKVATLGASVIKRKAQKLTEEFELRVRNEFRS